MSTNTGKNHVSVGMANFGAAGLFTMFLMRILEVYGHTTIPPDIAITFATMLGMFLHYGVSKWGFPTELDEPSTPSSPST